MSSKAADPTLEMLRIKIRDEMNSITDAVATGTCLDFSSYKELTGQILGLAIAERELLDLDERLSAE
jgi:hypothetical protein